MAGKAPAHPSQPDHQNNVLVYSVASDFHGNAPGALQAPLSAPKQGGTVYYRTSKLDGVSVDSVRPVLVESVCSSSPDSGLNLSSDNNENCDYKPDAVSPPLGWKRILSNGIIIYVSPSNTALSSLDQVKCYIQSEGTCKCGLECPLHIPLAFNFDPKVLTKPYSPTVINPGDLNKLCNHKRKLLVNMEGLSVDPRFGGIDALRRKRRRVVLPGSGGPVMLGNNQYVGGPGGTAVPQSAVGQHGVLGMYQGVGNHTVNVPHATNVQANQSHPQSHQQVNLPPGINLPQGVSLTQGASLQQQNSSTSCLPSGGPVVAVHQSNNVGMSPGNGSPSLLNIQQGGNVQSNSNHMPMQQNVIMGLPPNASGQLNMQSSPLSAQSSITNLGMQTNPPPMQQSAVLQQTAAVSPSPVASPALSGGSLPPPSPLSTRMTPPIVPSSSRSDMLSNHFVKMQQQIPSHEVWREGHYPNGFLEYMNSAGAPGLIPQSPTTSQDSALLQQNQIQGSPSSDLSSSITCPISSHSEEVQSLLNQSPMMTHGIVQNDAPVHQQASIPVGHQSSQVISQVLPNAGPKLSVSIAHGSIPGQQSSQSAMVSRFPIHMASQSPTQSPQSAYQINQPVQIQYDNARVCPPGYSIKYTKKTNNQLQHQVIEDHQIAVCQPQTITSYHNNVQSSQHFSHQQVVSNHHLIVSSQQNANSQQQIINAHHNIDQTSVAVQQNINQQSIQNVMSSKQSTNSQLHSISSQEVGSSSIGSVRTPPWHQNKQQQSQPQHQATEKTTWSRKNKPKDESSPSFLDDPSGYLAQQTAMLRQVVAGREEDEGPKTMASGHTASSNTLTSVLAGRTNTLTVSVGSQEPKPQQHILVSGNGQFIIAAAPKVNPPSPLLLPAPLLLQPIDTVQLPQLVVPPTIHEDVMEKRKSPNKKRKLSPTTSGTTTMLLSPQPQQQVLTILPGKAPIANMIQPLNVVQNFPIQQFLVPSMVMSDGTILQDTVQVNLLPGTGVFSSGQNLLTPASVVLRAPTTSQPQPVQQPKFIHSPNQFVNFSGELNSQVVPTTTNTTVVQQNTTTIVQQTTMVQQPSPSYILDKPNFILTSDKNNFILNPNGNGPDKTSRSGYIRNSVSTQTQNQVVQVSSTGPGGLMMTTGGSRGGSPPDTTTLSPADQEVSTSVTSPDPSMVHCVSSSNLDDSSPYQLDTTTSTITYHSGGGRKPVSYEESSYLHQPLQDKDITQLSSDDCSGKMLCTTTSDGSPLDSLEESDGLVN